MEGVDGLSGQESLHSMHTKIAYGSVVIPSVHRWTWIRGPTVQALQTLIQTMNERTFNGEHRTWEAGNERVEH